MEEAGVPVEGEARPLGARFRGVEGKPDHDEYGQIEKHQQHDDVAKFQAMRAAQAAFAAADGGHHSAPPSPFGSALRNRPMEMMISTIKTSDRALPTLRLLKVIK